MNAARQKIRYTVHSTKMYLSDAAAALLNIDNKLDLKDTKKVSWLGKVNQTVVDAQRKVIRLLVTAPSTSYLNLVGYGSAMSVNTITDAALALTYLGQAGLNKILGDGKNADESLRIFRQSLAQNKD